MRETAWITLAVLLVYSWITVNVGRARGKYNVIAPSIDGPIEFQSALRVQANTVEQMALFLPALWLCAIFFSDRWAAIGGAAWIVGRILFALAYYRDPAKRGLGFGISLLASVALMLATAAGLLMD